MKSFAAAVLAASVSAKMLDNTNAFMEFISTHGKSYKDLDEYNLRFANFNAMEEQIRHLRLT